MNMVGRKNFFIICIVLISSGCIQAHGQSRIELEKKKYKVQQEIDLASKLLNETQNSKKVTFNKLQLISSKIDARERLIQSIGVELEMVNGNIAEKEDVISEMENDLNEIRAEYAKLIQYSFIYRKSYDGFMYLLASDNINQLYKRIRFLQQIEDFRKRQANAITDTKKELQSMVNELEALKRKKIEVINGQEREKNNLKKESSQQLGYISLLKKKESELRAEINRKAEVASTLEKEINSIIEAEAKKRKGKNLFDELTPEEKIVSKNFRDNKGKLPWPTETGVIVSTFGDHAHPILKNVITRNHGIDISTTKDSYVRCVFDGEVSKVIAIPGTNYTVIIRHGSFLSVYQNIVDIRVKNNDKVKTKQIIGKAYANKEDNSSVVHFEIWNEIEKQNPEDWLSGK